MTPPGPIFQGSGGAFPLPWSGQGTRTEVWAVNRDEHIAQRLSKRVERMHRPDTGGRQCGGVFAGHHAALRPRAGAAIENGRRPEGRDHSGTPFRGEARSEAACVHGGTTRTQMPGLTTCGRPCYRCGEKSLWAQGNHGVPNGFSGETGG